MLKGNTNKIRPKTTFLCLQRFMYASLASFKTKNCDTFDLNSTLRFHLSSGQPRKALAHFLESQKQGIRPDNFTIPSLLKLSFDLKEAVVHGEQIHGFSLKFNYIQDLFVRTSLVDFYFKYGCFNAPPRLLCETPRRDVVLFTAMISGFSQNGLSNEALEFFYRMFKEGIRPNKISVTSALSACSQLLKLTLGRIFHGLSLRGGLLDEVDVILETALVHMYLKCGKMCYAKKVFGSMKRRNLISWDLIINGYYLEGSFHIALEYFRSMIIEGWQRPRSSTLVSVLNICAVTMDFRRGKELHGYILKLSSDISEEEILIEFNALINMYVKSGNIEPAIFIFKSMSKRNLLTWTTLISGYGAYGLSKQALEAFHQMRQSGIMPDGVTFVALLSACSHGGLIEEGQELFTSMQRDFNIIPEIKHFVCMVDLYGRAGRLEEARDFIKEMPLQPSKFMWGTLLSSCRIHKNIKLGKYAAERALELDPFDEGNYVLLSRLYADAGLKEEFAKVRSCMKGLGLKPNPACSWVEIKGKVHRFTVGHCLKPFSRKIYELLGTLQVAMEKASFVSYMSIEEEKANDLSAHTEKLALAFVLLNSGGEALIRVHNNLRMCRECHEFFKYVSVIYDREIILRDPNRFHRFKLGCCSCGDYW